jgi:hypothetical protein
MGFRSCVIVLTLGLSGCFKPAVLRIMPRDAADEEVKHALSQLPQCFRDALPDLNPVNAARLDLRVWAFDFEGGPFDMIIETIDAETKTSGLNAHSLRGEDERGRMLIWLQPCESSRMAPEIRDRFRANKSQVPDLAVGIEANDRPILGDAPHFRSPDKPAAPLWFGWTEVDLQESRPPVNLKVREVGTLLRLEATERGVEKPRKIILSFQAVKR